MNIVEVKDLTKEYRNDKIATKALGGVSFNIRTGEFVAIMGPSGSGKSTLMHIMAFLDEPTSGICKFEGKDISEFDDRERAKIRNKKMGFVFQSYNLLARTTVFDNVRLPLLYSDLSKGVIKKKAREAIEAVGLSHRVNFYPNQLAGGEQQRVAVARALVNDPLIVFADEPTGNLDSKSGQTVMLLLQELNEKGHTIVLVTHEKYTSEYSQRIIRLKDGLVAKDEEVRLRRDGRKEKGLLK